MAPRAIVTAIERIGPDMPKSLVAIVDDDVSCGASLVCLLRAADFDVEFYESAVALLARRGGPPLACIVSDIHMPGIDGVDLMRRLNVAGQRTPVILMTARGDPDVLLRANEARPFRMLLKPIGPESFLDCVTAAVTTHADDDGTPRLD